MQFIFVPVLRLKVELTPRSKRRKEAIAGFLKQDKQTKTPARPQKLNLTPPVPAAAGPALDATSTAIATASDAVVGHEATAAAAAHVPTPTRNNPTNALAMLMGAGKASRPTNPVTKAAKGAAKKKGGGGGSSNSTVRRKNKP